MNYQRIIIAGNSTKDAEQQTSKDGKVKYTTFRVGVSDGKEKTTFFPVTVFGKLGESVAEYITKGRQILVDGRVQIGDNGRCNIVADQIRFGTQPEEKAKKPGKKTKK
jgi:single-strand DNA-binding protein